MHSSHLSPCVNVIGTFCCQSCHGDVSCTFGGAHNRSSSRSYIHHPPHMMTTCDNSSALSRSFLKASGEAPKSFSIASFLRPTCYVEKTSALQEAKKGREGSLLSRIIPRFTTKCRSLEIDLFL